MIPLFSDTDSIFEAYTMEHFIPILLAFLVGFLAIFVANKYLPERAKIILGTSLALVPFMCVCWRMWYQSSTNNFDPKLDLPFFLCRFMALILPFVFYTRNRFLLGILYFWVTAGTINAIITPDLLEGVGHREYNLYWIYHLMLIVTIIYGVFVYKFKINWSDYKNAVAATILFSVFSGIINFVLKANYNYLSAKPEVASLLDYLGPWPLYIIAVYGLMFFLFFLALLPYLIKSKA